MQIKCAFQLLKAVTVSISELEHLLMLSMMEMRLWSILLAFVTAFVETAEGFKNGKVTVACESMVPLHDQHSPSVHGSSCPYMITVDKSNFRPGDKIKVSIVPSASGAMDFEGFLIEARDAGHLDSPAVGSFDLVSATISQLLHCGNTKGSAVSHTSDFKKKEIQVVWNAPKDSPVSVQFLATVVQHYSKFWVKLPGPVISQTGPFTTHPTTTVETTTPTILPNPFSSEECGRRKTCLRDPVGCRPDTDAQCFFLSFAVEDQGAVFELSGPAEGYVAFALSLDEWMGNDAVYLCVKNKDRVDIKAAYVEGRTYPQEVPGNELTNGRADHGVVHRHDRQPLISSKKKLITGPPEDMIGSRSPLMIKGHGVCMLIAWMIIATTGIVIARYFKPCWPNRTICGLKVWFQLHRGMMVLVVLLTVTGFILPFVYRKGWSEHAGAHPYLGCTVMTLAILQPFMAIFRPSPDSARRFIFNWAHLGAGASAVILAVAAMFLGVRQQALLLPTVISNTALAGFVIWVALAILGFEVEKRGIFKKGPRSPGDEEPIIPDASEADNQDSVHKHGLLAVFILGNMTSLILLLVSIYSV
ncbi:hypothetical protein GJAV_G00112910 [Gymnothorax javanicus]|nr:hypothetical protein GJAV_G00112910 [Gymnothorax javanicus]